MKHLIMILLTLLGVNSYSQEAQTPSSTDSSALILGAYADGYYSWYSNANDVALQQHDCIGAFHNNLGLNVAQITASYQGNRVRATSTFHFGDIPAITWANNYRPVQEANAGVRLAERLWLDLGFFKTHVGTESFLPKDNLMSIITLGTFYGPFYQSGARLSYDTKNALHIEIHAINGYNLHIDNNEFKTYGMLVSKQWGDRVYTSYSNMVGQERVGLLNDGYLVYQNVFANMIFGKFDLQIGADVAVANAWKSGLGWLPDPLYVGLATVKYHVSEQLALAFRAEVFSDEQNINSFDLRPTNAGVVALGRASGEAGMTIYGGTFSVEFAPNEAGYLRLESRTLYDAEAVQAAYPSKFNAASAGINPMLVSRTQVMATVGVYFDKTLKFAR